MNKTNVFKTENRIFISFNQERDERSALAKYSLKARHMIDWGSVEILEHEQNWGKRVFLESYHIVKKRHTLNENNNENFHYVYKLLT